MTNKKGNSNNNYNVNSKYNGEIQGSLHCAMDGETVHCFGRADVLWLSDVLRRIVVERRFDRGLLVVSLSEDFGKVAGTGGGVLGDLFAAAEAVRDDGGFRV
jgi:hypothetical protein